MSPLFKSLTTTIIISIFYFAADKMLGGIELYKKDFSELFSSVMIAVALFFWYHFFKTKKEEKSENEEKRESL